MANDGIKADIEKRMIERISVIGVDHTLVLTRLVAELKADVADLFNDNGSIEDVPEWPLVWRQGLVAGIEVYEEFDLQNESGKKKKVLIGLTKKVRFADRARRLELFGKHTLIRAFSDKKPYEDKGSFTAASILAQLKPTAVRPREDDPE
jgi:phage terminase small subunit